MGNRRRRAPKRIGINRRNFIKGAVAAPLLPRVGNVARADTLPAFLHGVASGDPLATQVILWTRVTPAAPGPLTVGYVVATDPALSTVVQIGSFITDDTRDYTVKVEVGGLAPATTYYYYQFKIGGLFSAVGRTRTLPVGAVDRMHIGVTVCASLAHGYSTTRRPRLWPSS
jgi:alkaline phosphatase D